MRCVCRSGCSAWRVGLADGGNAARRRAGVRVRRVLAWSVQRTDGWHLTTLHDGQIATPAIAPNAYAFDVDLGGDAGGRPVATFSRCADVQKSLNCRVRAVDLQTGVERDPGVPAKAGASDTTPSMWRGRIAFSRCVPGRNADVAQVYLFTAGTPTVRRLGFGSVGPCRKPNSCTGEDAPFGRIAAIDLGARRLAYLWSGGGPDSMDDAHEVRVVRLSDTHSSAVAFGHVEEACPDGDSPDMNHVEVPRRRRRPRLLHRNRLRLLPRAVIHRPSRCPSHAPHRSPRQDRAARITRGDGTLYALIGRPPRDADDGPTCSTASPCKLRLLTPPRFTGKRRSTSPPYGYLGHTTTAPPLAESAGFLGGVVRRLLLVLGLPAG